MTLYFLDSNIIMYALGRDHPLKTPCIKILEKIRSTEFQACTNTEVFQEILYRYWSIGKTRTGITACKLLEDIAEPILPVSHEDITEAMDILQQYNVSVRDAIHAATMLNNNVHHILSADTHFDKIRGIKRSLVI